MKNLETMLKDHAPALQPRRELSGDFTARIVSELRADPVRQKEIWYMRILQKPAIVVAAVAAVLITGGTAYAGTDGFTKAFDFANIFGYSKTTVGGKELLRVATSDCSIVRAKGAPQIDRELLFRKKDNGGSVGDQDILKYIQGYCEQTKEEALLAQLAADTRSMQVASGAVPVEIRGTLEKPVTDSLTVKLISGPASATQETGVYTSFHKDMKVTKGDKTVAVGALTVGREIVASGVDEGGKITILYIHEVPENVTYYYQNYDRISRVIEQVRPCSTNSSGYCSYGGSGKPQSSAPANNAPVNNTPAKQQNPISQEQAAVDFVAEAYKGYMGRPEDKHRFSQFATAEVATAINQPLTYDPVMCVQSDPGPVRFELNQKVGGNLIVSVITIGQDGLAEPGRVLADATYSPTLKKISSVNCRVDL